MKTNKNDDFSNRREFLKKATITGFALATSSTFISAEDVNIVKHSIPKEGINSEWRNKQPGMAYRRLGRTNLMVSEFLMGGIPIIPENYKHVELAIEMGLNYLDMAPAYNNGETEKAFAIIAGIPSKREKLFLTTKISNFVNVRNTLYLEIFDGLSSWKKEKILQKANQQRLEREVDKPGYFYTYFPTQGQQLDQTCLSNAMMKDYGHLVEENPKLKEKFLQSLEHSLKIVGTDYFDILFCPHGAGSPEELNMSLIFKTFEQLKKQGKVRFLAVSTHNDPAGVTRAAIKSGHYDIIMPSYNILNAGYLDELIREAYQKDIGVVAMKVAASVATHHAALQPLPNWRTEKLNQIVRGAFKPVLKAYLWALQNPNISAVMSNMWDEQMVKENLSLAGQRIELHPG